MNLKLRQCRGCLAAQQQHCTQLACPAGSVGSRSTPFRRAALGFREPARARVVLANDYIANWSDWIQINGLLKEREHTIGRAVESP